jgi:RNA recognition motif. (a.k.a. RRM, RBD, or RNP domain)
MQQFGQIISCMILRDNGKSRGFGFVTFADHHAAKYVTEQYHEIYGKSFGCNLIIANKEAKNYQNDKKSRKIYIKTKDKSPLIREDLLKVFRPYGKIEDLTILKDSKERSGFITFESRRAVDDVMKTPEIPYHEGTIICEICLSRKEIKKKMQPNGAQGTQNSSILNESMAAESSAFQSKQHYSTPHHVGQKSTHTQNYYMEEKPYFDYNRQESFGSKKVSSGSNKRRSSKHSPGLPPKKFKEEGFSMINVSPIEENIWPPSGRRYPQHYIHEPEPSRKNKYVIEISNVIQEMLVPIDEMIMSDNQLDSSIGNGLNVSAKQMKASISMDGGFSKSPRPSDQEDNGQNFLNIPNQAYPHSRQHSDNIVNPHNGKIPHLFKSGSIEQPMQYTEKERKLFLTEDERENKKTGSSRKSNNSKKEMLSSQASRSSQEPKPREENYKYNKIDDQIKVSSRLTPHLHPTNLLSPRSEAGDRERLWNNAEHESQNNYAECKSVQN